jgi:DNA invertase Pin-like site-specific DNA recombinase
LKIGYLRISTKHQKMDRQHILMKESGVEKIFEEKVSGKDTINRPVLEEMLNFVREGDVVYIESISRLGRSLKDLLEIMDKLNKKGVGLISLKESHINTTTASGGLVFQIFASMSEFERKIMEERKKEGIEASKLKGVRFGRPTIEKPKNWNDVMGRWKSGHISAVKVMEELGVKKSTFYRWVRGN